MSPSSRATAKHRLEPPPDPALANLRVPIPGWRPLLAEGLRRLLSMPPQDVHLFRNALAHAAAYGQELRRYPSVKRFGLSGYATQYSVAACLIGFDRQPGPLEVTLSWLLLELHLQGPQHGKLLEALAQRIGGLRRNGKLALTLGECDGLGALTRKMSFLEKSFLEKEPIVREMITGHGEFDRMWKEPLAAICYRIISSGNAIVPEYGQEPDRRLSDQPTNPLVSLSLEDEDDEGTFQSEHAEPGEHQKPASARAAAGFALALYRRSSPMLLREPDNVVPGAVVATEWNEAVRQAWAALRSHDLYKAGECLMHLLAIETGLVDWEARHLSFGTKASGVVAIDLRARALRRPEVRPEQSFDPKPEDPAWRPTGGDLLFPLSLSTVRIAARFLRSQRLQGRSSPLLLDDDAPKRPVLAAIRSTGSPFGLTASDYRLRLAAGLSATLGTDAAQIAFGDSFGTSAAATYYSAFPAASLATQLAVLNSGATGRAGPDSRCLMECKHVVGSRVRPFTAPFAESWQQLERLVGVGRRERSRAAVVRRWNQLLDTLALHLLLATACRPHQALANIRLTDVLPGSALIVLSDKQVDPAHLTRLACTGWRFIGMLQDFVAELERIARNPELGELRNLALGVLEGREPLFVRPVARGTPQALDVAKLLAGQPSPWPDKRNLHRHLFDQWLIEEGVDPELRFFQLGWMGHDAHATSDVAPTAPIEVGRELAPVVDRWLDHIGWLGGRLPSKHVDMHRHCHLRDWPACIASHGKEFDKRHYELNAALAERRQEVRADVLRKLDSLIQEHMPGFSLVMIRARPVLHRKPGKNEVVIDRSVVDGILRAFKNAASEPIQAYTAARELASLLSNANKRGICKAYVPPFQLLSRSRVPSPFLRDAGLAVSQVERLRERLVLEAGRLEDCVGTMATRRLAAIAAWSFVLDSPYKDVAFAAQVFRRIDEAEWSQSMSWMLRIPAADGHVVLAGDPAILVWRLRGLKGWQEAVEDGQSDNASALGKFILEMMAEVCPRGLTQRDAVRWMEGAARVAAGVELNGPERLVASRLVKPSTVTAARAASVRDGASIMGKANAAEAKSVPEEEGVSEPGLASSASRAKAKRPTPAIRELMAMFNPDYVGLIGGKPALPAKRRIPQLLPLVREALQDTTGVRTLTVLVLEYIEHLMTEGGPRSSGGMEVSTIYKVYHRIAPAFAGVDPGQDITELSAENLTGVLMTAFLRAPRRSADSVLAEIRRFVVHTQIRHDVASPEWSAIQRGLGMPVEGGDPALVADGEAARILETLQGNLGGAGLVDPVEQRVRELQLADAILIEATAARPRSLHGLTLADFHLSDKGDFIHLRARGRYASIKTSTSAGFIPLEGRLWREHRDWFVGLLERMRGANSQQALEEIPFFQVPGETLGFRYAMATVFGRVGELVRWSTGQPRGRTYWLRKRRVACRHETVTLGPRPRARDAIRSLRASGHAQIVTPMGSYHGDPLCYLRYRLPVARAMRRGGAAKLSGVDPTTLDQRWRRRLDDRSQLRDLTPEDRLAAVMLLPKPKWGEAPNSEAPPYVPHVEKVTWKSVESVLEEIANGLSEEAIGRKLAIDAELVKKVRTTATEFTIWSGLDFGTGGTGIHHPRTTPSGARLAEMIGEESADLIVVALEWASLARSASVAEGCPLASEHARLALERVSIATGTRLDALQRPGRPTIYRVVGKDKAAEYGAWPALRWALAVVWVADRVLAGQVSASEAGAQLETGFGPES